MRKEIFIVEKEIEEAPCEHPDCERFHQRFMEKDFNDVWFHMTKRTWWLVIDTRTGNQADNGATRKMMKMSADFLNRKLNEKIEEEKNSNSNINQQEEQK